MTRPVFVTERIRTLYVPLRRPVSVTFALRRLPRTTFVGLPLTKTFADTTRSPPLRFLTRMWNERRLTHLPTPQCLKGRIGTSRTVPVFDVRRAVMRCVPDE